MDMIITRALGKSYGRRVGLHRLDLIVPCGQVFGFLGPNGAGKTTTIRMLLGLLRPTTGEARILGHDCWQAAHRVKAEVGYVPGDLRLYPWLTADRALRLFGRIRRRALVARGLELADQFNLDPTVSVRRMSKGMRQKLGLILALAGAPQLLLLDEPSSALDPLMQKLLYRRLRELADRGHTVFFSSHTLSEVEQLCDRVVILREGSVVADERLDDLRRRAGHQVTIRWSAGSTPSEPPDGLLVIRRRTAATWQARLSGSPADLLRWLSHQSVDDLTIGQPNLESLFRAYYEHGTDA